MTIDSSTPTEMPASTIKTVGRIFTRDEIRMLNERSNTMGMLAVGSTWAVIVATLATLAWASTQPAWIAIPTFVLGLVILGGRHLALAILHHDAAHQSLFRSRWLNDFVGDWLCARPVWNDLAKYRAHHFVHHRKTSQPEDPDLSLIEPFPTTRASLLRKLARDLVGLTGLKYLLGRALMDAGVVRWTVASDAVWLPREGRRWWSYPLELVKNAWGMMLTNALLFAACWACGHAWLYAIWVLAYVTPYPLFLRIRSLAEHACTERSTDMFANTRTTRAGWLARMTVAPIRVSYHLEHHVLPGVPYFRLPLLHRMLRERGVVPEPPGYLDVLKIVSSGAPRDATATRP
ncbi:Fatty acid desaturase [Sandaracinus amylolyticus]|uniref:Fatty acid desaturase n=2 Tax=Sandaracinus amylolyticus TaxID=927083 RepID=A0A0F6W8U0_9BACT|nr:fatty acid desaturase family protein [Sandaracinus amylolyticus]AKF10330.1 Fatty acid desaturase [Sandaracinus amylolyticus]